MTIKKILQSNNFDVDKLDIELILAFILKKTKEFIIAHPEHKPNFFERHKFKKFLKKRKTGVPIAYLLGHKEFFGLDFLVNKYTLVPRPDTEVLVEVVVEELRIKNYELSRLGRDRRIKTTLIDVGTGTGCIPIAILDTLRHPERSPKGAVEGYPGLYNGAKHNGILRGACTERSRSANNDNTGIKCFATDISKPALKIAKKNAKIHNLDITFLQGNLLEPLLHVPYSMFHSPLIITANLPYLTQSQFDNEPSIQREPHSALVADNNGLALYKKLIKQIQIISIKSEQTIHAFFEIDPSQSTPLSEFIKTILPDAKIKIKTDLAGRDRVVYVEHGT